MNPASLHCCQTWARFRKGNVYDADAAPRLGARGGEESSEDDEVKWKDINWEAAWRQEGAQTKLKKRRRTHHGFPAPCLEMY